MAKPPNQVVTISLTVDQGSALLAHLAATTTAGDLNGIDKRLVNDVFDILARAMPRPNTPPRKGKREKRRF